MERKSSLGGTKRHRLMQSSAWTFTLCFGIAASLGAVYPVSAQAQTAEEHLADEILGNLENQAPDEGTLEDAVEQSRKDKLREEIERLADEIVIPNAIINALLTGDINNGSNAAKDFLTRDNIDSKTIAARSVALSRRLKQDELLRNRTNLNEVNNVLGSTVNNSLCSPRIVRTNFARGYQPPEGTFAYDLGSVNTPLANGFKRLTPSSQQISGSGLQVSQTRVENTVIQDTMTGVRGINLEIPNGDYRIILLTSDDAASNLQAPFGTDFMVNDQLIQLGRSNETDWLNTGHLVNDATLENYDLAGGLGGAIQVEATITEGLLNLDFQDRRYGATGAAIAGLIIEPIDLPSSFDLTNAAHNASNDLDECLELLEVADEALASDEFAELNPAAGPQSTPTNLPPPTVTPDPDPTPVSNPTETDSSPS